MKTHLIADSVRYPTMTTAQIRDAFLIDALYEPGALNLAYVDLDRRGGNGCAVGRAHRAAR